MPVGYKDHNMWHCLIYGPLTVKYILTFTAHASYRLGR